MSRNVGRAGGASAGVIAVVFGVLQLLQKTPSPWLAIGLGVVAILGVVADYVFEQQGAANKPAKQEQRQRAGKDSNAIQAGGNVSGVGINTDVPKADE